MPNISGYKKYITVEGDTFDALALAAYNEETLAHYIIQANPEYCDTLIFDAGIELYIPIMDSTETPDTLPPWRRE